MLLELPSRLHSWRHREQSYGSHVYLLQWWVTILSVFTDFSSSAGIFIFLRLNNIKMFKLKKTQPVCLLRVEFTELIITWMVATSPFSSLHLSSISLGNWLKVTALGPRLPVTQAGCPLQENHPIVGKNRGSGTTETWVQILALPLS